MKRIGARSSSETAHSRSRPWVTRARASGGSRRTSFVSTPDKNRVAAVTKCGSPEKKWSWETRPRVCRWRLGFKSVTRAGNGQNCLDEGKEKLNEETAARHRARTSCCGCVRFNCGHRREIPKTYGWVHPRQVWRHGVDG